MFDNNDRNTLVHVPTPGDHYSGASGSAIMTIIYELNRRHSEAGYNSVVIAGEGTRADYPVGKVARVPYAPLPGKKQKIVDVALGRMGLRRHFISRVYKPTASVFPRDFCGVIVVHNGPAALRGLRMACPQARICLYCNNDLFGTYSKSEAIHVLRDADHIICVSNKLSTLLKAKLGYEDPRVAVVLNGVDTDRFVPPQTPPPQDVPVILFVGRVIPVKGPDLLIKSITKIANGKRQFKLRIVGSNNFNANDAISPFERELRDLARPVSEYIEFVPFVDRAEVVRQYQAASIFCAPSNWDDPCPLTVVEAMATGLPVVGSTRGGIPEEGADAALYFTPPDIDELAKQLAYLIDNPDARIELGARARRRAEELSWARQYELLRQVWD